MQNAREIAGINLFVGTSSSIQQIPDESKHYALVMILNEQEQIVGFDYYDPIQGKISVLQALPQRARILEHVKALAQSRGIPFDNQNCHMLHLSPAQIHAIFPTLVDRYIKSEADYAQEYYSDPKHVGKFNRKDSGLSHSYLFDPQQGIIQLANKAECRVVWGATSPADAIFENLPDNTSAVYRVIPEQHGTGAKVYYMKKGIDAAKASEVMIEAGELQFFESFKLNNRGLSRDELTDLENNLHLSDRSNVYGTGGFARVKKSRFLHENKYIEFATKIIKFKKSGKFEGKFGGRTAQESSARSEAQTVSDFRQGSPELLVIEDKGYINMFALGEPLTKRLQFASLHDKLDYAIKFLIGVEAIHSGEASAFKIKHAHRDLKPDNILVDEHDALHLIDHSLTTTDLHKKTGEVGGTLYYAPLDQDIINHYLRRDSDRNSQASIAGSATANSLQSDSKNASTDDVSTQDFRDSTSIQENDALLSDSEDDAREEWDPTSNNLAASSPKPSVASGTQKLPAMWTACLADPARCITQNYLEDDKVAALRTVYCNPNPKKINEVCSILNTQDFESLPRSIRELLDSTTVAQLLTPERRQETEGFFAAVLIFYQLNPNLPDAAYQQTITDLRQNPVKQKELIELFQRM